MVRTKLVSGQISKLLVAGFFFPQVGLTEGAGQVRIIKIYAPQQATAGGKLKLTLNL